MACGALIAPAVSVTVTEKLNGVDWATEGAVPESTPAAEIESHPGKPDPCQVNGEVPPVSASDWLYTLSEVVCGSGVVVTACAGLIVSANAFDGAAPNLSVT